MSSSNSICYESKDFFHIKRICLRRFSINVFQIYTHYDIPTESNQIESNRMEYLLDNLILFIDFGSIKSHLSIILVVFYGLSFLWFLFMFSS